MKLEDVAHSPHFQEHAALARPGDVRPSRQEAEELAALSPRRLAARVEDPRVPMAQRLAAGGVLALLGDPRIDVDRPATCPVPGGSVEIGLDPGAVDAVVADWAHVGVERSWIDKETPVHTVVLRDFWIGRYPVTNEEYRQFLADTGHPGRPATWYLGAYPYDRSNHPVAGVRAEDADAYAAWLSDRTGHPWRLPTEAEWEYAAKGPDGGAFPWGGTFDASAANTRETGVHTTTPVGAFPAGVSPFGAHDMAGNVEEFTADDYRPYPGGPFVADHLVETMTTYRVARGGSFSRFGDLTRTRRRHGAFPGPLYPVGFRLATGRQPL
ncbi:formylglycine-generating enzyme family protein [Streptomyces sp. NPDC057838]|uniref:formylglycine-generating enzyme family protein n=1 Tax=unclassified Streptomyces TaxID=2593676 RepID=UPI003676B028